MTDARSRLWLDLLSSLFGVGAGVVVVASGLAGPLTVGGTDLGVAAMGLLGAGFAGVGIGHLRIEDTRRGMGELLAGVGAIFFGLSYLIEPSIVPFALGVLGLGVGGIVLVLDSFDVDLPP